jgi:cytochrome c oxidase subunit 3
MSEAVAVRPRHAPHLAHHFETPAQQFESGKLGMWLFLATEVLMFGGLFCAYAIYRGNHPEIFEYGHRFLDVKWGGINTIVLICSSLTMAWGVRAAQLGQRRTLIAMLSLTLLCACGFMAIKYVEYRHKIQHGLMWGTSYRPDPHLTGGGHGTAEGAHAGGGAHSTRDAAAETPPAPPVGGTSSSDRWVPSSQRSSLESAAPAPAGLAPPSSESPAHGPAVAPRNAHIFFGIYFAMTGLHGIHVLAGMIVITGLLFGAAAGRFGPAYFTPVDLVGLYWHIVDLIWIFLFPLLYLIH